MWRHAAIAVKKESSMVTRKNYRMSQKNSVVKRWSWKSICVILLLVEIYKTIFQIHWRKTYRGIALSTYLANELSSLMFQSSIIVSRRYGTFDLHISSIWDDIYKHYNKSSSLHTNAIAHILCFVLIHEVTYMCGTVKKSCAVLLFLAMDRI